MNETAHNLSDNREEVQEVLTSTPHWLLQSGISLVFASIILIITLTWFIKYPDKSSGTAVINTAENVVRVMSMSSGRIDSVFVNNFDNVSEGTIIASLESDFTLSQIMAIEREIKRIGNSNYRDLSKIDSLFKVVIDAQLRNLFRNLIFALERERYLSSNLSIFNKRLRNIEQNIQLEKTRLELNKTSSGLFEKELDVAKEKFNLSKIEYDSNLSTKFSFLNEESIYIQSLKTYQSSLQERLQIESRIYNLGFELDELNRGHEVEVINNYQEIGSILFSIENYLESWRKDHLLVAPVEGKVHFIKPSYNNVWYSESTALFAIAPDVGEYHAILSLSSDGFGKIKLGQESTIFVDNFPAREFGGIKGRVTEISLIPDQDSYKVRISLGSELVTTTNRVIDYFPEMSGQAEVVTNDIRLFERFVSFLKDIN